MPHLRNFDTEPPLPYCYEFRCDNRLESVITRTPPPICTSARSQTALVSRAGGVANDSEYIMPYFPQRNDFARLPVKQLRVCKSRQHFSPAGLF